MIISYRAGAFFHFLSNIQIGGNEPQNFRASSLVIYINLSNLIMKISESRFTQIAAKRHEGRNLTRWPWLRDSML